MKIEDRTFIVSGGSSGLGLATVENLLASSAFVSILDLAPPQSAVVRDNARVQFHKTDITSLSAIETALNATVAWSQETRAPISGVVNCAGVGSAAKILDSSNQPHNLDIWDTVLAINLTGTFNLTRLVVAHIATLPPLPQSELADNQDGERGVVILVSSAAAFEGQPGQAAYAASKGALRSMALPLARDLERHSIRVVAIAPGAFSSNMTDAMPDKVKRNLTEKGVVFPRRFGKPEEFAQTVKWIVECPYVNGETIRLSGGGRLPGKL